MPRRSRLEIPGLPLHVIQRGVNRSLCFRNDADRGFYLRCLATYASKRGCAVHAYVLMDNHVHLLVTPSEAGTVAAMMQDIGRKYVRVTNTLHGRTGTLWEGRFKSGPVDTDRYYWACHRYIELNPVRAGIVRRPEEYRWSSHNRYRSGKNDSVVRPHNLYEGLGRDENARRQAFAALFSTELEQSMVLEIRAATNSGCPIGSEAFQAEISVQTGEAIRRSTRGRPPKRMSDLRNRRSPVSGKLF